MVEGEGLSTELRADDAAEAADDAELPVRELAPAVIDESTDDTAEARLLISELAAEMAEDAPEVADA